LLKPHLGARLVASEENWVAGISYKIVWEGHGFYSLRGNSGFDFVLKGPGFSRAVSAANNPASAAEGALSLQCHFFRGLF
jgi:hypothetical protein